MICFLFYELYVHSLCPFFHSIIGLFPDQFAGTLYRVGKLALSVFEIKNVFPSSSFVF